MNKQATSHDDYDEGKVLGSAENANMEATGPPASCLECSLERSGSGAASA
jgi:hypothetical protein